jgi:hypothetical protein
LSASPDVGQIPASLLIRDQRTRHRGARIRSAQYDLPGRYVEVEITPEGVMARLSQFGVRWS